MKAWRASALGFALVVLASASAAAADDEEDVSPFEARSTAVFLHTGLQTPVGVVGFEAEQAILPIWTVSAGVGMGPGGGQIAGMTHLRFGGSWSRFEVGAGLSHGKHVWKGPDCSDDGCVQKSGTVTRANLELGGTHRWPRGFSMRYYLGYGRIIAGELVCDGYYADRCNANYPNDGQTMVYAGLAVGGSF